MTDKQMLKWLDQLQGEVDALKKKSGGGGGGSASSELIELPPGDNTNSRTFTLSKTPKKVTISWHEGTASTSWMNIWSFLWGDTRAYGIGGDVNVSSTGQYAKVSAISYGADGKSFTFTGQNPGNAANTFGEGHSGRLFVEY